MKSRVDEAMKIIKEMSQDEFYEMVIKAKGPQEANDGCQYCMTEMDNEVFKKRDFSGQPWEIELMLNYRNQGNLLTIDLTTDENYEYVEIPINYCPFCGRKL